MQIRTVAATRYLTPLREGGSLPAIVQADDGQLYVMKFRGSGHGPKMLIAELVAGEIARALGLNVPELIFVTLDPAFGISEPNEEIRKLLQASVGLNLALAYLPDALTYNVLLPPPLDVDEASTIVWFDAYTTNVDRTPRNVNLLLWQHALWLIDQGACLYFHYGWDGYLERSRGRFPLIKDHALLRYAAALDEADAAAHTRLSPALLEEIVGLIPDAWLGGETAFPDLASHRQAYVAYLVARLAASALFVEEAQHARAQRFRG